MPSDPPLDSRRSKSETWVTVTGPSAHCMDCPWAMNGDGEDRRLASAARFHARDAKHQVQLSRGQVRHVDGRR